MTNYYDNKGKNLFVMFSIFAFLIFSLLQELSLFLSTYQYYSTAINADMVLIKYLINIPALLGETIPAILIFVFAILIFKEYSFKKWMLPIFFFLKAFAVFYTIVNSIINIINAIKDGSLGVTEESSVYTSLFYSLISLASCILLFIGSLNNFKFVIPFKIGAILPIVLFSYQLANSVMLIIYSYTEVSSTYPSFGTQRILGISNYFSLISLLTSIVFYISLLVLTNRKKRN